MLRALWEHRPFIASLVRRQFQIRSVRAVWGNAWLVIQPAIQILIYMVIFAEVLSAKLPGHSDRLSYGLYLCAGLLPWTYFHEIMTRSQTLFLDHADLLKTVRFPRSALAVSLLVSATLNFAVVAVLLCLMLAIVGHWPGISLVAALPLLVVQSMLGLGLGLSFGILNVFFRDVGQAVSIVMQFWFWLTPIVYPLSIVPEELRTLFVWNPMGPVIAGYQGIVLGEGLPDWQAVLAVAGLACVLLLVAWGIFRRLGAEMVDEL